jgi:hypothetical protein
VAKINSNTSAVDSAPVADQFSTGISTGRMHRRSLFSMIASFSFALSGCSLFNTEADSEKSSSEFKLPTPQMPADAVVIELQFLRMSDAKIAEVDQLWQITDEQVLPVQTRKRLEANGLRIGLVPGDMPTIVQQWIAEAQQRLRDETLEQASVASNISLVPKQLTFRAGKRKEILLHAEQEKWIPVIFQEGDQLCGETFEAPEFILGTTAIPHGDGRATLLFTPEIKYGQVRNVVVGKEAAFRFEWQRQRRAFDELLSQITLSPGQTVIITCTEPPKGLGSQFFITESFSRQREHVLVLMRLSKTQLDELFDPAGVSAAERSAVR